MKQKFYLVVADISGLFFFALFTTYCAAAQIFPSINQFRGIITDSPFVLELSSQIIVAAFGFVIVHPFLSKIWNRLTFVRKATAWESAALPGISIALGFFLAIVVSGIGLPAGLEGLFTGLAIAGLLCFLLTYPVILAAFMAGESQVTVSGGSPETKQSDFSRVILVRKSEPFQRVELVDRPDFSGSKSRSQSTSEAVSRAAPSTFCSTIVSLLSYLIAAFTFVGIPLSIAFLGKLLLSGSVVQATDDAIPYQPIWGLILFLTCLGGLSFLFGRFVNFIVYYSWSRYPNIVFLDYAVGMLCLIWWCLYEFYSNRQAPINILPMPNPFEFPTHPSVLFLYAGTILSSIGAGLVFSAMSRWSRSLRHA